MPICILPSVALLVALLGFLLGAPPERRPIRRSIKALLRDPLGKLVGCLRGGPQKQPKRATKNQNVQNKTLARPKKTKTIRIPARSPQKEVEGQFWQLERNERGTNHRLQVIWPVLAVRKERETNHRLQVILPVLTVGQK